MPEKYKKKHEYKYKKENGQWEIITHQLLRPNHDHHIYRIVQPARNNEHI